MKNLTNEQLIEQWKKEQEELKAIKEDLNADGVGQHIGSPQRYKNESHAEWKARMKEEKRYLSIYVAGDLLEDGRKNYTRSRDGERLGYRKDRASNRTTVHGLKLPLRERRERFLAQKEE